MANGITSILTGSAEGSGAVVWEHPEDPRDTIHTTGGVFILLLNLTIREPDLDSDLFTAEWSDDRIMPQTHEYHTQAHVHRYIDAVIETEIDSGPGPRLVYQKPLQFFSFGKLPQLDDLQLVVSHPCDVELVAINCGPNLSLGSMGVELR
jgi:hypothetical protein